MPRMILRALLASALGAAAAAAVPGHADVDVLHRERSLYQTILVTRQPGRLCLQFSRRLDRRNQSCVNPRHPKRMVFTYTRMMMAALLLNPEPTKVLVAGLGGGTLPTALRELLPTATIEIVEIDPAVLSVAEDYFAFAPSDRVNVHIGDARVFVKRRLRSAIRYDLIMLDAYSGDYIPEHLMTAEFLEETRALLTDRGVVAANTFSTSRLYDHESATYRKVFGPFFNFKTAASGNRIILATSGPLPSPAELRRAASRWQRAMKPYRVTIADYPPLLSLDVDWDTSKRPLTDQYAPANLLRE